MPPLWTLLIVLGIATAGYVLGRHRALASVDHDGRRLHSLPSYYGSNVALWALVPALLLLALWLIAQPLLIQMSISAFVPAEAYTGRGALSLIMSDVNRIADGLQIAAARGVPVAELSAADLGPAMRDAGVAVSGEIQPYMAEAARRAVSLSTMGGWAMTAVVVLLSLGGAALAWRRTDAEFRARNAVERVVMGLLIAAACIAILTTLGIVLSLIFNTLEFFKLYPASEFFFGTTWSPSFGGGSQLGILPLFWGTFYISIIALLVAVPVGLFAAVYLSEYASGPVRAIAKPLLEVLAGIPTIVYGLFALLTVGPLLVSIFGQNGALGVGWMQGGTAVMTAGLVMGVMLIPFVSSLSDDIINAVPQAMRDGSLGLGATRSETIKQVVLPAALPGIVGAILLAASRAIGETMIVVLGAGAAARLSMNPFDAMTTVTAKIVSQLTGDADFASPEALVAFALGMTLFVITLALNIFALWIVRRYREQYE